MKVAKREVYVRWLIRVDVPTVVDIEKLATPEDVWAWPEEEFLKCMMDRNCIANVAELLGGRVVGFFIWELYPKKVKLLKFVVHPCVQLQGFGSQMMQALLRKVAVRRRGRVVVTVDERNLAAQLFLRSQGFKATWILRDTEEYRFEIRV